MANRVLISGGAGFIGTELIGNLRSKQFEVHVLDNLLEKVHGTTKTSKFESRHNLIYHFVDIRDLHSLTQIMRDFKFDVLVHLAAETGTGQSLSRPTLHTDVNLNGLATILEAFTLSGYFPSKILNTSSRAVYGEGMWQRDDKTLYYPTQRSEANLRKQIWNFEDSRPVAMDSRSVYPNPVSIYGVTKYAQEELLKVWCRSHDVALLNYRLQNVFGSGQSKINPYTGILPLFIQRASEGKTIELFEDGEITRDFIHVADVARALLLGIEKYLEPGFQETFDIGTGKCVTLNYLAGYISNYFTAPSPVITGQYRIGDVRHAFSNIDTATQLLGWTPKVSLESGLEELILNGQYE